MTSEEQVSANRANALKSTGPLDCSATRYNARKHALLAKDVVIDWGLVKESRKEFEELHERLRSSLSPDDFVEEMLIERIAVAYWRLRRVIKAEKGYIQSHFVDLSDAYEALKEDDYQSFGTPSTSELEKQGKEWEDALEKLEAGTLSEKYKEILVSHHGSKPDNELIQLGIKEMKGCLDMNTFIIVSRQVTQEIKKKLKVCHHDIPSESEAEHLMRYEASIEKQLYRALTQLIQLKQGKIGFVSQKTLETLEANSS